MDFQEKARTSAWIFQKNVFTIPGSDSENQHGLFKSRPASNVSSLSVATPKERERIHCGLESFTPCDEPQ